MSVVITKAGSRWEFYDTTTLQPRLPATSVRIPGSLTVVGAAVTEDVYLTLNNDKTAGVPNEDGGLRIRRGASPYAGIWWYEAEDAWIVGTSTDGTVGTFSYGAIYAGSLRIRSDGPLTFGSGDDIGLARVSAGVLKVTDGGAGLGSIASNYHYFDVPGTVYFQYASSSGIYWGAGGVLPGFLSNAGVNLDPAKQYSWGSTAAGAAPDTGLARVSAGVVRVTDGGAGYGLLHVGAGTVGAPSYSFAGDPNTGIFIIAAGYLTLAADGVATAAVVQTGLLLDGSAYLAWTNTTVDTGIGLFLYKDAANVLAQRNSTNAQAFRVYNTTDGAGNAEWLGMLWATNTAYLITQQSGTGSARNLVIGAGSGSGIYFRSSGTDRWLLDASGHLVPLTNDAYDIGTTTGPYKPRHLYLAGSADVVGNLNVGSGSGYYVNGTKVVGAQGAAVADATGAGDVVAQLNALLARLRTHGLIAT